jgi:hypothetical protein
MNSPSDGQMPQARRRPVVGNDDAIGGLPARRMLAGIAEESILT